MTMISPTPLDVDPAAVAPFGLYVAGPGDPMAAAARELERSVFFEAFGNTPELLEAEYGRFDDASAYLCIVDHQRGVLAGMIRLILDRHGELKSMTDIEHPPWEVPLAGALAATGLADFDRSRALDVATLAVAPEYRGKATRSTVSFGLYQAVLTLAKRAEMDWLVTILDVVVLRQIQVVMRKPFSAYEGVEPMRYLDSPASMPVYSDLRAYGARLQAEDEATYTMFFDGVGTEAAISPPDWDAAAQLVLGLTSRGAVVDLRDAEPVEIVDVSDGVIDLSAEASAEVRDA